MTILDRIKLVTDNFVEGDKIELLYKIGDSDTIYIAGGNIDDMPSYVKSFEEDGRIDGLNAEGEKINIVDFKLIK